MWEFLWANPRLLFSLAFLVIFLVVRLARKDWGEVMARILISGIFLLPAVLILPDLIFFNTSNEEPIWRIIAGIIVSCMGLIGLLTLFPQLTTFLPKLPAKKCKICGQPARDVFIIEGDKKEGVYCRRHIIEKFQQTFRISPFPMVVFHPEQEREYCGTMYPYFALDEMVSKFNFEKKAVDNIGRILSLITGKCQSCGDKKASVAYYSKGILTWDGSGPAIDKVISPPKVLCSDCTLKMIISVLTANKEFYVDNGLFAPYRQSGVYVNTYL